MTVCNFKTGDLAPWEPALAPFLRADSVCFWRGAVDKITIWRRRPLSPDPRAHLWFETADGNWTRIGDGNAWSNDLGSDSGLRVSFACGVWLEKRVEFASAPFSAPFTYIGFGSVMGKAGGVIARVFPSSGVTKAMPRRWMAYGSRQRRVI